MFVVYRGMFLRGQLMFSFLDAFVDPTPTSSSPLMIGCSMSAMSLGSMLPGISTIYIRVLVGIYLNLS